MATFNNGTATTGAYFYGNLVPTISTPTYAQSASLVYPANFGNYSLVTSGPALPNKPPTFSGLYNTTPGFPTPIATPIVGPNLTGSGPVGS